MFYAAVSDQSLRLTMAHVWIQAVCSRNADHVANQHVNRMVFSTYWSALSVGGIRLIYVQTALIRLKMTAISESVLFIGFQGND